MHAHPAMLSDGFTMVEIMVVLAVVGLLAAITVPNFRKFSNVSRQSEAKLALTAIYVAEKNFAVQSQNYTVCLSDIGVNGAGAGKVAFGAGGTSYYTAGFKASNVGVNCSGYVCFANSWYTSGPYKGQPQSYCTPPTPPNDSKSAILANAAGDPSVTSNPSIWPPSSNILETQTGDVSSTTMIAKAVGNISSQSSFDSWQIDQTGALTNTKTGL